MDRSKEISALECGEGEMDQELLISTPWVECPETIPTCKKPFGGCQGIVAMPIPTPEDSSYPSCSKAHPRRWKCAQIWQLLVSGHLCICTEQNQHLTRLLHVTVNIVNGIRSPGGHIYGGF